MRWWGKTRYTFDAETADFKHGMIKFGVNPPNSGTIKLSSNTLALMARNAAPPIGVNPALALAPFVAALKDHADT